MSTTTIFSLKRLVTRFSSLRFFRFCVLGLLGVVPTTLLAMSSPLAESSGTTTNDASSHAVVLVYHHFADDTPASTSIRPEQFERQLDYLAEQGFELRTLGKVLQAFENGEVLPEKTLILTADDAYRSVYTYAFPALQKRGWAMTVFANTQPVEQNYRSHMTWAQLAEMQAAGFEIANHGHTHDTMVRTPDETHQAWSKRLQNDIDTAQTLLTEHLPEPPPKLLAYPYGEYSLAVKQKIRDMGYVGVSQHSGAINAQSDHGALLRFPVNTEFGGMERFGLITHTRPLPVKTLTPADTLVEQNPPSLTLTFHNAMTQSEQKRLQCFNQQGDALTLHWDTAQSVTMTQSRPLAPPRNRYACTQQTDDGPFRWFSHLWMLPGFHSVGNVNPNQKCPLLSKAEITPSKSRGIGAWVVRSLIQTSASRGGQAQVYGPGCAAVLLWPVPLSEQGFSHHREESVVRLPLILDKACSFPHATASLIHQSLHTG